MAVRRQPSSPNHLYSRGPSSHCAVVCHCGHSVRRYSSRRSYRSWMLDQPRCQVQPFMYPSHRHPAVSVALARSAGLATCSLFNIPLPAKGEAARSASLSSALLPSAFPRVPFSGKCRAHVEPAYIRAAPRGDGSIVYLRQGADQSRQVKPCGS